MQIYQVDAFTGRLFAGNPAAVCPLSVWLDDSTMQNIALENNLSETAFLVPAGPGRFQLRWFTPTVEVELCGHATLASAFIVFSELHPELHEVRFDTRFRGELQVRRTEEPALLEMDLPAAPVQPAEAPSALLEGLGVTPESVMAGVDYMVVVADEQTVRNLAPDLGRLAAIEGRGVIVTAPGTDCDFVSRFFAPSYGVPEDPVTGSAHCTLTPYWSRRLGRKELHARQLSSRGGELWCSDRGERILLRGRAVTYMEGKLRLD